MSGTGRQLTGEGSVKRFLHLFHNPLPTKNTLMQLMYK